MDAELHLGGILTSVSTDPATFPLLQAYFKYCNGNIGTLKKSTGDAKMGVGSRGSLMDFRREGAE
jgi:hypothetical protein